jgi:DNA-binding transcriptional regulator YiaG
MMKSIEAARKSAGLTRKALSDITKIPERSIVNWENGSRKPPEYVVDYVLLKIEKYKNA